MTQSHKETRADPRVTLKLGDKVILDMTLWLLILQMAFEEKVYYDPTEAELYLDGVRVEKPVLYDDDEDTVSENGHA